MALADPVTWPEPAETGQPLVSVIVIACNEERRLPVLLEALASQTLARERFEILVIDDGSQDRTGQIARDSGVAKVIATEGGLGDAARNVGLAHAAGSVIAITDADCRPASDWLERAVAELERRGAEIVAGHIEVPLSERPSLAEKLDYCRYLDQERAVREIGSGVTANLIVRRSVFDRVGRFNDRLFAAGDREFGMRAAAAGCRIVYSRAPVVVHPPKRTARGLIRRSYRGGVSCADLRRFGSGPAATSQPLVWLHPGAYRPSRRIYGLERLEALGQRVSPRHRIAMSLGQWAFIQLPIVAGSFVGALRRPTRRAPQHAG